MINISLYYILGFSTIVICLQCYERLQFFHLHIVIKKNVTIFWCFQQKVCYKYQKILFLLLA